MAGKSPPRTADALRDAIDSGKTGEKTEWPDPAAAPLGTDAEAAGRPPDAETVAMATPRHTVSTRLARFPASVLIYVGLAIGLLLIGLAVGLWAMGRVHYKTVLLRPCPCPSTEQGCGGLKRQPAARKA